MTPNDDRFWDDLGIAWRAVEIPTSSLMPHLQRQIRRDLWRQRRGLAVGGLAGFVGIATGIAWMKERTPAAIWLGAIVIASIAVMLALFRWVRAQSIPADTATLVGMIEISIAQARRWQRDTKAGYAGCVLIVLVGASLAYIGYAHLHFPLRDSTHIMIAAAGTAIFLSVIGYRGARRWRDRQTRFEYLKRILLSSEEQP